MSKSVNVPAGEEWRAMVGNDSILDSFEADQAVRKAKEGIEQHRKSGWTIRVVTPGGKPIVGAEVQIKQLEHEFAFGDGLWALDEAARYGEWNDDKTIAYRTRLRESLNAVNALSYWTEAPRNDASKTMERQGEERLESFVTCVDWALSRGMKVKGHTLLWSIDKCWPTWLHKYDIETQMKFAEVRVRNLVARFAGRITMWDVVNEALWEPVPANLPHRHWPHLEEVERIADYVHPTFKWAREEDKLATLVLNDYGMEQESESPPTALDGRKATAAYQRSRMLALLKVLKDRGTPIDAVGLQSHTGSWQPHDVQWAVYDEIASSGLQLQVTEFWARQSEAPKPINELPAAEYEIALADYLERYLTVAYGHPAMNAFFFWGFMGKAVEWKARSSHRTTATFERIRKLIYSDWHTSATLTTDAEGCVNLRAFPGLYAIGAGESVQRASLVGGASRKQLNEIVGVER